MLLFRVALAGVVECLRLAKEQTVAAVEAIRMNGRRTQTTKRSAKFLLILTPVVAQAEVQVWAVRVTVRRRRLAFRQRRRPGIGGNPWVDTIPVA